LGPPVTLDKVYNFEPVPSELSQEESRNIIGAQGCVWTEFLKRPRDIEYMLFPRALALAEVLWSKRENKNFPRFTGRLYKEFANLDREKVNYRIPEPRGFGDQRFIAREKVLVELKAPIPDGKIYYTFNGTIPHEGSHLYTSPFVIVLRPNEIVSMRAKVLAANGRESPVFTTRYSRGLK
jgi:hexosaminidase